MGNYPIFERIVWFDQKVRNGEFPNASKLAKHFELSSKTAQRNIDFMRDRLAAPLEYNATQKGYFYSEQTFGLPYLQTTQEEILSILIARNLLSRTAGGVISRSINRFGKKLFAATGDFGLTESRMEESFSSTWTGYSPAHSETFRLVADALLKPRVLRFAYTSPGTDQKSERQVEPYHLQHYMASWVLTAWCRLRGEWRKFLLARMDNLVVFDETFKPRPIKEWKHLIDDAFGIFQTGKHTLVTLRFTPFRARWIREQIWHPKQILKELADGSLELSFPVADFREVKLKVLQFGADVEVVAPEALRKEVQMEIQKMATVYGEIK